jgi:hypothetical protein
MPALVCLSDWHLGQFNSSIVRWIFGGYNFLAIIYQISEYFGGCFWRLVWLLAFGGFFGTTDWSD